MKRSAPWWAIVAAACAPSDEHELPALPDGTIAVAVVSRDHEGAIRGRLMAASGLSAVTLPIDGGGSAVLHAYGASMAGVAIPTEGAEVIGASRCQARSLPVPELALAIPGDGATVEPLEIVAPGLDCLAIDPSWSPLPSDASPRTCRALSLVRQTCAVSVIDRPQPCSHAPDQLRPTWDLRVNGAICELPRICEPDPRALAPVDRSAVCPSGSGSAERIGLARTAALDATVETVPITTPQPIPAGGEDAFLALVGQSLEVGTVIDFVAYGDDAWEAFGAAPPWPHARCQSSAGTRIYRVDRRTGAVTERHDPDRGCMRAPLEQPDGGYLVSHRRTVSASAAASLWLARVFPDGRVIDAPIPDVDGALSPRPEHPGPNDRDDRAVIALVDTTTSARGRRRAVAVINGGCPQTCLMLHEIDADTLAPLGSRAFPSLSLTARSAHRDGDELVIAYDSPDRIEVRPVPLQLVPDAPSFDAMAAPSGITSAFGARRRGVWLMGIITRDGRDGGIRVHHAPPPSREHSMTVLGAQPDASAFSFAAHPSGRLFAFFTLSGSMRQSWIGEVTLDADRRVPPVLDRSLPLGAGVISRVRADADGVLWALVPERAAFLRITVR